MSHFGRPGPRRVLVIVTVSSPGPVTLPPWISRFRGADIFALNPLGYPVDPADHEHVGETFLFTDPTGGDGLVQPSYLLRSENEILRRSFRDLLRWGKWDTLVIDGLKSIAPLIGDGGIELPRSLSTTIYHERLEDIELISEPVEWYQLGQRMARSRLKKWHRSIVMKSVEVIRGGGQALQRPIDDPDISP